MSLHRIFTRYVFALALVQNQSTFEPSPQSLRWQRTKSLADEYRAEVMALPVAVEQSVLAVAVVVGLVPAEVAVGLVPTAAVVALGLAEPPAASLAQTAILATGYPEQPLYLA